MGDSKDLGTLSRGHKPMAGSEGKWALTRPFTFHLSSGTPGPEGPQPHRPRTTECSWEYNTVAGY